MLNFWTILEVICLTTTILGYGTTILGIFKYDNAIPELLAAALGLKLISLSRTLRFNKYSKGLFFIAKIFYNKFYNIYSVFILIITIIILVSAIFYLCEYQQQPTKFGSVNKIY
jgi:hypothetical protein